jgi:hypothetical protein
LRALGIAAAEGLSRLGRLAHRFDRAEIDKPAAALSGSRSREPGRRCGFAREDRRRGATMGSLGKMDDDIDIVQLARPAAVRGDFAEQARLAAWVWRRRPRAPQAGDDIVTALREHATQRAPDKAAGAGHQKVRHPVRTPICRFPEAIATRSN